MTNLRTAAKQALEALTSRAGDSWTRRFARDRAIEALEAALAEPVPTVAENATTQQQLEEAPPSDYRRGYWDGFAIGKREGRIEAEDEPAQQAEPVEPVAWMYTGIKQDGTEHGPHLVWKPEYMDAMSASKGAKATPLYTAPPQRKPLTQEEIPALAEKAWKLSVYCDAEALLGTDGLVALVRAVEQAHGIKE